MRAEIESTVWSWPRFRDLLLSMTWRDIKVRYSQSMLGAAWAVVLPLAMMLVFNFAFGGIQPTASAPISAPYPLFLLCGLVPWIFFSTSLNACVNCLVANRNLITKIYFPREVFPASCMLASAFDFGISFVTMLVVMSWYRFRGADIPQVNHALCYLPLVLGVQCVLALGLGMWLAMANLFYRDVRQLLGIALQLWMFVSGVVVAAPHGSRLANCLSWLNPMVPLIAGFRDAVLYGHGPAPGDFLRATFLALTILISGAIYFRRASYRFAECI